MILGGHALSLNLGGGKITVLVRVEAHFGDLKRSDDGGNPKEL